LNHVRGWYFWLRRQLGLKKAIDTIKKIGHHEKRIANDIIHKITREIVKRAIETNSLIVLGKLKGLRNQEKKKGRGRGIDIWNKKLSNDQIFNYVANANNPLNVNGTKVPNGANYRDIKLDAHDEIAIVYGTPPSTIPTSYKFPERVINSEFR
jgi:hypothetical protein